MQIVLPFQQDFSESFETFFPGDNQELLNALQKPLVQRGTSLYFWGPPDSGRSHLLRAACMQQRIRLEQAVYIPLEQHQNFGCVWLEGLEQLDWIALDNLEAIAGCRSWEVAIFNLYNAIKTGGKSRLLISANAAPKFVGLSLPDLTSRLTWGLVYRLHALTDQQKIAALKRRAHLAGFELPEEVGRFLLGRLSREPHVLFQALQKLDQASMQAQRKLTIPFVKSVLSL